MGCSSEDADLYGGGGGGGCVAITAGGELRVSGTILANGGNGADSNNSDIPAGAGGSGGGILLSAQRLTVTGTVSAKGGDAGRLKEIFPSDSQAGAGGGGRIFLHVPEGRAEELVLTGNFNVSGGTNAASYARKGGAGQIVLQTDQMVVPAGQRMTVTSHRNHLGISRGDFIPFVTGNWRIDDY